MAGSIKRGLVKLGYGILITAVSLISVIGIGYGCRDWYIRNFKDDPAPAVEEAVSDYSSDAHVPKVIEAEKESFFSKYGIYLDENTDLVAMINDTRSEISQLEREANSGWIGLDDRKNLEKKFDDEFGDALKKTIYEMLADGFEFHSEMPLYTLIKDVCIIESRCNPNATSYEYDKFGNLIFDKNGNPIPIAHGLMQITYDTMPIAERIARDNGLDYKFTDPYDVPQALTMALLLLDKSYKITSQNKMESALTAYNSGYGTSDNIIAKHGKVELQYVPFGETRKYLGKKYELDQDREHGNQILELEQKLDHLQKLKEIQEAIYTAQASQK